MPDGGTHFILAAVTGGVAAVTLLVGGKADQPELLLCFAGAVVGGMAPDLDADHSHPLNFVFSALAVVFSYLVMFSQVERYSVLELVVVWLAAYLFIRLVVFRLFVRFTVHRGMFHSLPAVVLYSAGAALILWRLFGFSPRTSWLVGAFVGMGALLHLVLDELYGLNLFGAPSRARVGSALKLFSRDWLATLVIYLAAAAALYYAPGWEGFLRRELEPAGWQTVRERFYPRQGWFGWQGEE